MLGPVPPENKLLSLVVPLRIVQKNKMIDLNSFDEIAK
jgi:hypothetical protein